MVFNTVNEKYEGSGNKYSIVEIKLGKTKYSDFSDCVSLLLIDAVRNQYHKKRNALYLI